MTQGVVEVRRDSLGFLPMHLRVLKSMLALYLVSRMSRRIGLERHLPNRGLKVRLSLCFSCLRG